MYTPGIGDASCNTIADREICWMNKRTFLAITVTAGLAAWSLLRTPPGRFKWRLRDDAAPPPVALITGASAGLGAEFARQLAARGFDLVLVARRADRLAALAQTLTAAHGIRCETLAADLGDEAGVMQVETFLRTCENLAVLVNNAGFATTGKFVKADPVRQQEMVYLHTMAPMRLTQAALPSMKARTYGAVINVSSVAAYIRLRGNVNYSATKAYLNAFSEVLDYELRGTGVYVQALCPGFTRTEFHSTPDQQGFDPNQYPTFMWATADDVVRQSLAAIGNGQVVFVPGMLYRVLMLFLRTPGVGDTLLRVASLLL